MTGLSIIAAVFILLVIGALILSRGGSSVSVFFKLLGAGFTASQVSFLRKTAKSSGFIDLSELLRSPAELDKCTAFIVKQVRHNGTESDKKMQDVLSSLYECRRKMDLDDSRKKPGLATSRDIKPGQPLRIIFSGMGNFSSKVIENSSDGLIIDLPRAPSVMATSIDWDNKQLKVFFHRVNDAGYVFFTSVIPNEPGEKRAVLRLRHVNRLDRFQMRQNTRAKCSIPAQAYILSVGMSEREMESESGIKCVLQDLSGTGAMFLAKAQVSRGARIKLQFMIQDEPIIMAGIAKEANYNDAKNTTVVNFECTSIDPAMRNMVLALVYNVLPKREEIADTDFIANRNAKTAALR